MSYVYILKCAKGKYYVGSTNNIDRRLAEHASGKTASLRHLLPLELVFKQEFPVAKARLIEKKLKKFKNRNILNRIIQDKEIKMGL